MSSPETSLPSGNLPPRGRSSRLVKTEETPSTGTSQPSGESREQTHEHEMLRALKAEKKISRIEVELAQTRNELAQARNEHVQTRNELAQAWDKIDDLEAVSEFKDRQLGAAVEHGDRPSTATDVQQIARLGAALAQAQEEIQNLKAVSELQLQEKDEIRDFNNALLKDFHTAIALAEDHTRTQDSKLENLGSAADKLNTAVEQANDRTEVIMADARRAYSRGTISHEVVVETEELYLSEAELLVSVREAVANQVVENDSSLEKLRKFNAAARSRYGRYLGDGISSAYPKPSSGPERSDVQQDNAIAEQGDTTGGNTPTERSEAGSMFRERATAEEGAQAARGGDMQRGKAKAANPRKLARRKIGKPSSPKPKKRSESPAELEMLRLTNRQTLHCLEP